MEKNDNRIMFSAPASVEMQAICRDIVSKKGSSAAENEILAITDDLEKLKENPFMGVSVPKPRRVGENGRVTARRGLRVLLVGGKYVAYYKATQSDVNIYHVFERGTRYPTIVERDLAPE